MRPSLTPCANGVVQEIVEWDLTVQEWQKFGEFNHRACENHKSDWHSLRRQLDKIVKSVRNALWRSENIEDKDTDLENYKQMSLFVHESRGRRSLV